MLTKQTIRQYLNRILPDHALSDDDKIFESGMVNSMFAMELVLFIEKTFNIKINNNDLSLDNFSSINTINKFVINKKNEQEPTPCSSN